MLDVSIDGQRFQEMHVNGGAVAQAFLYPPTLNLKTNSERYGIQRKRVAYIIRNGRLLHSFPCTLVSKPAEVHPLAARWHRAPDRRFRFRPRSSLQHSLLSRRQQAGAGGPLKKLVSAVGARKVDEALGLLKVTTALPPVTFVLALNRLPRKPV